MKISFDFKSISRKPFVPNLKSKKAAFMALGSNFVIEFVNVEIYAAREPNTLKYERLGNVPYKSL